MGLPMAEQFVDSRRRISREAREQQDLFESASCGRMKCHVCRVLQSARQSSDCSTVGTRTYRYMASRCVEG